MFGFFLTSILYLLLGFIMKKEFPKQSKGFHPYGELIGLSFTELGKGFSECLIEVDKRLFNPHKVLHGGIIYSMADTGMGGALYSLLEEDELCATIEVKINYFKSVREGTLTCRTKVIHKGKNVAVLESEVKNEDHIVAKAIGTYMIFKV
ncbi:MAG: PaaI family thioesterase [Promethearchaeota archaeon]|nr:MAG: PaaI family thioesterase [Candidatus Lokiarchaeota archaeon]